MREELVVKTETETYEAKPLHAVRVYRVAFHVMEQ